MDRRGQAWRGMARQGEAGRGEEPEHVSKLLNF